jgi:hypothetical protein
VHQRAGASPEPLLSTASESPRVTNENFRSGVLMTANGRPPSPTAERLTWLSDLADAVAGPHPGITGAAVVPPGAVPAADDPPPDPRAGGLVVADMLATSRMTPSAPPVSSVMWGVLRLISGSYAA